MNSVIICLPSKGADQEKRINTKYTRKVGGSGEEGGSQEQLLTPSNRGEKQAHGLPFHVICEKPRRGDGVDIMAFDTSPRKTQYP